MGVCDKAFRNACMHGRARVCAHQLRVYHLTNPLANFTHCCNNHLPLPQPIMTVNPRPNTPNTRHAQATMERVAALHHAMRVQPAQRAHEVAEAEARRRHLAACEAVAAANAAAAAEAEAAHEAAVAAARSRNQARVDWARQLFLEAHADWERTYLDRLQVGQGRRGLHS